MTLPNTSRGARVNADIVALLRARNTLIQVVSKEEERFESSLVDVAKAAEMSILFWDCVDGITTFDRTVVEDAPNPVAALAYIEKTKKPCVFVMRDIQKWGDPQTQRKLRSVARALKSAGPNESRAIILLSPSAEVTPELSGHAVVVEYPLPDRVEVGAILDAAIESLPAKYRAGAAPNGTREAAIDAAMGLSQEEIESCFARSLVTSSPPRIDPSLVGVEKKKVISRQGLQVHDPDPRGLDAIGGLDQLKAWTQERKLAFSAAARAYGLDAPKGCVLVGPPGTGKSLAAKCFATAFGLPLFRADLGAQKSKFVGESEQNIRKLIAVAEAAAPCVLWIDEIDKVLKGASGDQGDGGVGADQLGVILNWMQETKAAVFVVATANDVRGLPPELLRRGRFDQVFFVDLPTQSERVEILNVTLRAKGRDVASIDGLEVARETEGWTGSEIAAVVPDAMLLAFADGGRPITTADLLAATKGVVPLSKLAGDRLAELRKWAEGRARRASSPETTTAGKGRVLGIK
jgi:ATPase family associated with various cellular activities (AAA)